MLLARSEFLKAYETMRLIREFEEALLRLHGQAKVPGFVHVSVWQEAVSAGVGLHLQPEDQILTSHRGHGDIIAKGVLPGLPGPAFAAFRSGRRASPPDAGRTGDRKAWPSRDIPGNRPLDVHVARDHDALLLVEVTAGDG